MKIARRKFAARSAAGFTGFAARSAAGFTAAEIDETLRLYEKEYQQSTDQFLANWEQGKLDHGDCELARWALLAGVHEQALEAERTA